MKRGLTYRGLALRRVRFYWRTEVSVFLGTVVAAAALVGGLLVGDCVSYSLRRLALLRLGNTELALIARGRFFDAGLAARLENATGRPVSPALVLRAVVLADGPGGETRQANHVQVVGVDARFWRLAPAGAGAVSELAGAAVNARLAEALGVQAGSEISLRLAMPSLVPRDAPLASRGADLTRRGRVAVREVLSDARLGRFSLAADQSTPASVFVDIGWLQNALDLPGRANVLLAGPRAGRDGPAETLAQALARTWRLEDAGIRLRSEGELAQLESDRIFLDPALSRAALAVGERNGREAVGVLAYLVNGVRKGERFTPYSFAVAVGPSTDGTLGPVPPDMRDDEMIINAWLADQLNAGVGDRVTLSYYELAAGGTFTERTRDFTVRAVAPMSDFERERALLPVFPGLSDVEQCRDWDVGMPMDEGLLQDPANEDYWERYRATPKLAVTLAAGRAMWSNRFGDATAVRYRAADGEVGELQSALERALDPAALGLFFVPVREQALKAVSQAMNFGDLFVAMSAFLIAAALLLTGMLFVFGIQQRAGELGLLLGVGYRPADLRRLFLWEGGVVALAGVLAGGGLGLGYTRLLVWGLARHWQGAVAGAAIQFHAEPGTLAAGMAGSLACALAALAAAMWRQARRPVRALLTGTGGPERPLKATRRARRRTVGLSSALVLAAAITAGIGRTGGPESTVMAFFGAGFLLVLGGIGFTRGLLQGYELSTARRLTVAGMGMRNAARRGGRSLTAVALLACGTFMVVAVSAMQQDLAARSHERSSGTGGFALFAESTLPAPDALESDAGRKAFGWDREAALEGAEIVSLKVRDGDDASCFNLNRAQAPRLVGVDPAALRRRGAFTAGRGEDAWSLLESPLPDGVVPGLAGDANTAMWNLRKKVGPVKGDELVYTDERGATFRVKLVGTLPMPLSVFQGTVLISRADFAARYPSEDGYRMFLVDLPAGADTAAAAPALARRLERVGADVDTTLARMRGFYSVESTYLGMFLVLGGLGVVLGTLGLGIVVLRNMLERRSEWAMLRCVGFTRRKILRLVLAEHWLLLCLGLLCGGVAAAVAMVPSLAAPGVHVPVRGIAMLLGAILLTGWGSTALAAFLSLRGAPLDALRAE